MAYPLGVPNVIRMPKKYVFVQFNIFKKMFFVWHKITQIVLLTKFLVGIIVFKYRQRQLSHNEELNQHFCSHFDLSGKGTKLIIIEAMGGCMDPHPSFQHPWVYNPKRLPRNFYIICSSRRTYFWVFFLHLQPLKGGGSSLHSPPILILDWHSSANVQFSKFSTLLIFWVMSSLFLCCNVPWPPCILITKWRE